jgi:hypothetical protein
VAWPDVKHCDEVWYVIQTFEGPDTFIPNLVCVRITSGTGLSCGFLCDSPTSEWETKEAPGGSGLERRRPLYTTSNRRCGTVIAPVILSLYLHSAFQGHPKIFRSLLLWIDGAKAIKTYIDSEPFQAESKNPWTWSWTGTNFVQLVQNEFEPGRPCFWTWTFAFCPGSFYYGRIVAKFSQDFF